MATEMEAGTGGGLLSFLDWAGRKGEMTPATAKAWAATARAVLAVEAEPNTVDLRSLDTESLLDRFETLNRTRYSSGSMATYRSRFRAAVSSYNAWLDGDPSWKPATKTKATRTRKPNAVQNNTSLAEERVEARTHEATLSSPHPHTQRQVAYDLPLRPDMLVRLTLPVDLTTDDAERVAAFVRSLAFASPPAQTAQGPTADDGG